MKAPSIAEVGRRFQHATRVDQFGAVSGACDAGKHSGPLLDDCRFVEFSALVDGKEMGRQAWQA
jgi:hypothetical protein